MQRQDLVISLIVIIVWGLNFIAIKVGLQDMPPLMLGTMRFLFATFPVLFFLPRPPVAWSWLIILGLTINVGQFSFLFWGMQAGMPAGLASLVMQSQAFFTLLVAVVWLGEKWQFNHVIGLILSVCGMAIIGSEQGGNMTVIGFGLTLAAAACWGTGNVIMRRATLGVPPFSMLSLVVWAGAVAIIPLALLSWFIEGQAVWAAVLRAPSWKSFGAVIYLAFFATLIGYGLWAKLLSRYPAAVVAPLALLVPIVGMSSSSLVLGEQISLWQAAGSVLIMAGLLIHVTGDRWLGRRQQKMNNP
jgi:O-acetylserine/cysteine efflux transporter